MSTPDGLDPPGEQLALFADPAVVETVVHVAITHGYGAAFHWSCTCGASGPPTATYGRANGGRNRHLRAALKRARAQADRP